MHLVFACLMSCFPILMAAQATTGSISGKITSHEGVPLNGASVRVMHEPTRTQYFSQTAKSGLFVISNLPPGGPYTIEAGFINYDTCRRNDITVNLGEDLSIDLVLKPHASLLRGVTVTSSANKNTGNIISRDKMDLLPGRNIYEHLRAVPQAKLQSGNEGAVSFAGQNNRYNSLYVDGAVNNDVFGLAASGTNGGQAGISVLPADAIAQFQVIMTPYDASLGNFTGAAINATTRSGTNRPENAVYHFFSNRSMSGKTPTGDKHDATKPEAFFTRIYGVRTQGAVIPNRFFYFINMELQRDLFSQPFSFADYRGGTKDIRLVQILANTIRGTYHYDPGIFSDNPERVNVDRIVTRFDWNISRRHIVTIGNRYTYAERIHTNASNANTIYFSNSGYALFSGTHSFSAELKSTVGLHAANKLLITYTQVKDDREPLEKPFPRVRINDGDGAFIFGTDNSSTVNLLMQSNWSLSDKYKFTAGTHSPGLGMEMEYNKIHNAFIQNSFGSYTYFSLGDFLTGSRPSAYQLGFPVTDNRNNDHTRASADFSVLKTAFFVNDEIRFNRFILYYGIRYDAHFFVTVPEKNEQVNTDVLPKLAAYHDLANAASGARIRIPATVSPRIGFTWRLPKPDIIVRGGAGLFAGRLPLAWPGGVYNNNGLFIGGFAATIAQLNKIRFRPDPYHPWTPVELGAMTNKEPLNLIAGKFNMPELWRMSFAIDKKWEMVSLTAEAMFSKNISEIKYTNVNLLPPIGPADGPDQRSIYPAVNNAKIPLNPDGSNPYDYVILLSNNTEQTGYAWDLSTHIKGKCRDGWKFDISYHFGRSYATNDGTSSVNLSQWRSVETVNGRNFAERSVSDFSAGHGIFVIFSKTLQYPSKKTAATLSWVYSGQSGSPVSYVYEGSMTRDDGPFGAYDLIYIPTHQELDEMQFLPNLVNGNNYTPQQQKEALDTYIEKDPYLKKTRGRYAERNGSRTPFTHIVDLRVRYDIRFKTPRRQYQLQITYDLFNFTNLLNRNWGRRYLQPNDNIALIGFAGYTGPGGTTPQYRFNPGLVQGEKWMVSPSTTPAYSARWNGQLGIRLIF